MDPPVDMMINKHASAWNRTTQVAHTGGRYKGLLYTSSREAICKNFLDGFRHFEIDVVGLGDGNAITAHDGTENAFVKDAIEFEKASIGDVRFKQPQYTIMRLEELCDLTATLGIYIIVDVKNLHRRVYELLFNVAKSKDVLHRIIPQAYDETTLAYVREIGFPLYLMTLWGIGGRTPEEKIAFCRAYRPAVVWLWAKWATPEFEMSIRDCGVIEVGVHGDMVREKCLEFMHRGIHVMSDCAYIGAEDTAILRQRAQKCIEALYWLHLGRPPDAQGLKQKLDAVVAGHQTIPDVQFEILLSAEFQKRRATP